MAISQPVRKAIAKIRLLAAERKVRFTQKALRELECLELGLWSEDICEVLAELTAGDFLERVVSAGTGEWLYVFRPVVVGEVIYLKVVIRGSCIVVSFHEDERHEE